MSLIVQKYGGTSVGSPERIKNVARRVARWQREGHQVVVVVSAMSGETNRLIALAREIQAQPDPRELDVMVSTGEQVTVALLAMALTDLGLKSRSYTGGQVRILTDSAHTKARILSIDEENLRRDLKDGYIVVVAGFQGVDEGGNITTLGRGGSDTTGVALAAALKADECQIYTDVDGVYTTDPRIVPEARRLKTITFEEMLEMASLGSKVLQIRSVEFAGKYKVKLRVLSSFEEEGEGTLITFEEDDTMEQATISGIAFRTSGTTGLPTFRSPCIATTTTRRSKSSNRWRRTSRRAKCRAATKSPRCRSSASACARTRASPARRFARWPRKVSISR